MDYELSRSKRKTLTLCVSEEGKILVKAPEHLPKRTINDFVLRHRAWIEKQLQIAQVRKELGLSRVLSEDEITELRLRAKQHLPMRIAHFASLMQLTPQGIKVTSARTRWGSCSARNSLCFSYRVMLLPDELIDYVVVHELAHIKEKNHSNRFYAVVAQYLPDYRERIQKIREITRTLPK